MKVQRRIAPRPDSVANMRKICTFAALFKQ